MPRRVVPLPTRGLLQSVPANGVAAAAAPQRPLPPVNASWLRALDSTARDSWRNQQRRCAEAMTTANKEAAPLDLVLYGALDSVLDVQGAPHGASSGGSMRQQGRGALCSLGGGRARPRPLAALPAAGLQGTA